MKSFTKEVVANLARKLSGTTVPKRQYSEVELNNEIIRLLRTFPDSGWGVKSIAAALRAGTVMCNVPSLTFAES